MSAATREVDGHIHRALEGKTIRGASKDGVFLTLWCTNGEKWAIGWADFVAGKGFPGEPAIISIDDMRLVSGPIEVTDGSIHRALEHRTIESARTDGEVLYLQCTDGRRYGLAWVNPQTQERVKAEPCLCKVDVRVMLGSVNVFDDGTEIEVGTHAFCGGMIVRRGSESRCTACSWRSNL